MMGFLNDDDKDTNCFFGVSDQLTRKKSNTVGHVKRPKPVNTKVTAFQTIIEDTHLESAGDLSAGLR